MNLTKSIMNDLNAAYNEEEIERGIESVFKKSMKGKYYKTCAKVLYNILIKNRNLFKGHLIEKIEAEILSRSLLKIFVLWQLQQAIDYSLSRSLNYEGITTLRDVIA